MTTSPDSFPQSSTSPGPGIQDVVVLVIENSLKLSMSPWVPLRDNFLPQIVACLRRPDVPLTHVLVPNSPLQHPISCQDLVYGLGSLQFDYDHNNRMSFSALSTALDILSGLRAKGPAALHLVLLAASQIEPQSKSSASPASWNQLPQHLAQLRVNLHIVQAGEIAQDTRLLPNMFYETIAMQGVTRANLPFVPHPNISFYLASSLPLSRLMTPPGASISNPRVNNRSKKPASSNKYKRGHSHRSPDATRRVPPLCIIDHIKQREGLTRKIGRSTGQYRREAFIDSDAPSYIQDSLSSTAVISSTSSSPIGSHFPALPTSTVPPNGTGHLPFIGSPQEHSVLSSLGTPSPQEGPSSPLSASIVSPFLPSPAIYQSIDPTGGLPVDASYTMQRASKSPVIAPTQSFPQVLEQRSPPMTAEEYVPRSLNLPSRRWSYESPLSASSSMPPNLPCISPTSIPVIPGSSVLQQQPNSSVIDILPQGINTAPPETGYGGNISVPGAAVPLTSYTSCRSTPNTPSNAPFATIPSYFPNGAHEQSSLDPSTSSKRTHLPSGRPVLILPRRLPLKPAPKPFSKDKELQKIFDRGELPFRMVPDEQGTFGESQLRGSNPHKTGNAALPKAVSPLPHSLVPVSDGIKTVKSPSLTSNKHNQQTDPFAFKVASSSLSGWAG